MWEQCALIIVRTPIVVDKISVAMFSSSKFHDGTVHHAVNAHYRGDEIDVFENNFT